MKRAGPFTLNSQHTSMNGSMGMPFLALEQCTKLPCFFDAIAEMVVACIESVQL